MNKVELLVALYCLYAQPVLKGYAAREPLVYLCRTRLAVSGVLNDLLMR